MEENTPPQFAHMHSTCKAARLKADGLEQIVVLSVQSSTLRNDAGRDSPVGRMKTTPLLAGAGCSVMVDAPPECRPMPMNETERERVVWGLRFVIVCACRHQELEARDINSAWGAFLLVMLIVFVVDRVCFTPMNSEEMPGRCLLEKIPDTCICTWDISA